MFFISIIYCSLLPVADYEFLCRQKSHLWVRPWVLKIKLRALKSLWNQGTTLDMVRSWLGIRVMIKYLKNRAWRLVIELQTLEGEMLKQFFFHYRNLYISRLQSTYLFTIFYATWILAETIVPVKGVHKSTLTAITEVSSPSLLSSYVPSMTYHLSVFFRILVSNLNGITVDRWGLFSYVGVTDDSVVETSSIGFLSSIFCYTTASAHHLVNEKNQ